MAKQDIKGKSPFEFRSNFVRKADKGRTLVGNKQILNKHLSYYRNLILEENSKDDLNKDPIEDAFDISTNPQS